MPPKLTLIQGGLSTPPPSTKTTFCENALIPDWDGLSPEVQNEILSVTAAPETDTFIFKPDLFLVDPE